MSDVSQGPGWWLASDGKWYPPHTAPQATLPPDAAASYPQYAATPTADTGTTTGTETYGGQAGAATTGQPGTYGTPVYQPQQYQQAYGTGYGYPTTGVAPSPDVTLAGVAPTTTAAPGSTAPAEPTTQVYGTTESAAPAPRTSPATRWQPWLAVVGIALVLWGAGQAVLAWSEWHLLESQFSPYGTVTQGHVGMALSAAGTVIAGLATVVMAMLLDRR